MDGIESKIIADLENTTPYQKIVLDAIASMSLHLGHPPTVKELALHLGKSPGSLQYTLLRLQYKKLLKRDRWRPRSIRVDVDEMRSRPQKK